MGSGHYFQQTVNFDLKEEFWYFIIKEKRKHLRVILLTCTLIVLYCITLLYIDQHINCTIVFILSLTAMETSCMGAQGLSPSYRDIEVDGRVIDRPKDPPGQKSIYILPGATEREVYRLTTFKMFPQDVPIDIMLLAKCGFHFTGYKDRVKCFSCGVCVESWMIGDDPTAAKWHFESCELVLGTDERNVPISSFNGAKNKLKFTHDIKRPTDFDSGIGSMTSSHCSQPNSQLNQDVKIPGGTSNGRITPDELMSATQSVTQSFSSCHIGNGVSNVNIQIGLNNVMANGSSNGAVYQTAKYVPPVSGASGRSFNSELAFANIVNNQHKSFLMSIDLCKETNRRESFKNWKEAFSSQFVENLARSGFFYLGNLDRTQCFSCAGVLRNWRPSDDVNSEHYRHFPNCKMLNNNELRNVEIPVKAAPSEIPEPADPSPEQLAELGKLFKLNNPINPHMRDVSARVATFDQRWPSRKVKASPTHIAKAGFYFLGDRDRAKCWYCNGGLQNWDPMDEPWAEHAKWFPGCEFVLRNKGIEFVRKIYLQNPTLRRPTIQNPRNEYLNVPVKTPPIVTSLPTPTGTMTAGDVINSFQPPSQSDANAMRFPSQLEQAMQSEVVATVEGMGFDRSQIQTAVERQLQDNQSNFNSAEVLLNALLDMPDDVIDDDVIYQELNATMDDDTDEVQGAMGIVTSQGEGVEVKSSLKRNNEKFEQSTPSENGQKPTKQQKIDKGPLYDELKSMEIESQCRSCKVKKADTLVIPCGHISFCSACAASNAKKCAICKGKIAKYVKVFMA